MNKKYIVIKNKNLAIALSYLTSQEFYTYDNVYDNTKKVYSFENTELFNDAIKLVNDFKKNI